MIFRQLKPKKFHIEMSERCNASCPMCGRTTNEQGVNPHLGDRELPLDLLAKILSQPSFSELEQLRLCGNFGDPAASNATLPFVRFVRENLPRTSIRMNSNGGIREPGWWYELGRLLSEHEHLVSFSVDGLQETNHIYRRGVIWERLEANLRAFVRGGGRAQWVYLVFEHNEHQLVPAKRFAQELGFVSFTEKASKRFLKSKALELRWSFPVNNTLGELLYELRPGRETSHQNPRLKVLESQELLGGNLMRHLSTSSIDCRALRQHELYLSAEGLLLPCCWTGASLYPAHRSRPEGEIWELIAAKGGKDILSVWQHPVEKILESSFFEALVSSWGKPSLEQGKPFTCARICGKGMETFEQQFQHAQLSRALDEGTPFEQNVKFY